MLALLCEAEVAHREERRLQMGLGITEFPYLRTLEGFDFTQQPSLDPKQVRDLAACQREGPAERTSRNINRGVDRMTR